MSDALGTLHRDGRSTTSIIEFDPPAPPALRPVQLLRYPLTARNEPRTGRAMDSSQAGGVMRRRLLVLLPGILGVLLGCRPARSPPSQEARVVSGWLLSRRIVEQGGRFLMQRRLVLLASLAVAYGLTFVLAAGASAAVIYGTPGNDCCLVGGGGNDVIWAYGGNDVAYGRAGNDDLHMGSGTDDGFGQDGADEIYGGAGGSAGRDEIKGAGGRDILQDVEGPDDDLACGGPNDDMINLEDGDSNDFGYGNEGADSRNIDYGDYWNPDGTCPS